jgi:DNA-3-methyladenine glycosylase II
VALVETPEPFDFELSTARFRAFGLDRANVWEDGALYRAVGGQEVRVAAADGGVEVEPLDAETEPVVRKLLGFDFDLVAFSAWAAGDELLAPLVVRFAGFRPSLAPDPFEALVTSITAQQVSLFAAFAIRNRLIERFGRRVGQAYAFPTAEALGEATQDELTALGFSRRKAEYVLGLAQEPVDLAELASLPDEEVKRRLVSIRGIGEWTAEWFLARHLARPRAWPVGDVALEKAVAAFYPGVGDLHAARARFEPFQNLSAHYLLTGERRSLATPSSGRAGSARESV